MKITPQTLHILKNMCYLNQTLIGKAGSVIRQKPAGQMIPFMEAEVEEVFPVDFQIYDLPKFLSMLSMFEDPDVDFKKDQVIITDSNGRRAEMRYASLDAITDPVNYNKKFTMPSVELSTSVSHADISTVFKAAKLLSAPQVAFRGDGSQLKLSSSDMYNDDADTFSIVIGETDLNCNVMFDISMLTLISGDYNVEISFRGIAKLRTENVTYWMGASGKSTYE